VIRRTLRLALRLYPRSWRDVHGDELAQLADDLLDDQSERPWRVAASTAVGALRERLRPKYLSGGRLVVVGMAGAAVALAVLAVVTLIGRGSGVDLIPTTAQSTGRLATLTGMEAVLNVQHVRVTVNGVEAPLREIAGRSVGFEETAATRFESTVQTVRPVTFQGRIVTGDVPMPVFKFSPIVAVKRAIAYQVLTDLAASAAPQDGHVVSQSAAHAYAEEEYAAWRSHPVSLPHVSGRAAFLSAEAVTSYRQALTVNSELVAIAGPPGVGSRTPALRRWMDQQLAHSAVTIDGVPGLTSSNLAASLPPQL